MELQIHVLLGGRYLNLPVIEEDGRLVAIVDVLKLTYAMLEQVRPQFIMHLRHGTDSSDPVSPRIYFRR